MTGFLQFAYGLAGLGRQLEALGVTDSHELDAGVTGESVGALILMLDAMGVLILWVVPWSSSSWTLKSIITSSLIPGCFC